uniref:Uncharacterized protein n=1 Tax=Rhizophora mucronata TaxID=61149 RepID=A0A2P2IJ64_RHIMU
MNFGFPFLRESENMLCDHVYIGLFGLPVTN